MVGTLLSIKPKTGVVVVVAVEVAVAIVALVAVVAMGEVDPGLIPEQDTEAEAVMVAGREVIVAMIIIALVMGVVAVAVVTGVGADTVAVALAAVLNLAIGGSDKACTSSLECLISCLGSSVKPVGYAGRLFQIRVSFATPCSCEF